MLDAGCVDLSVEGEYGYAPPSASLITFSSPVDGWLKAPHTFTKVAHAQHFSFFTICPASMADREPAICKDPPGFDRAEFHQRLNDQVTAFFLAKL